MKTSIAFLSSIILSVVSQNLAINQSQFNTIRVSLTSQELDDCRVKCFSTGGPCFNGCLTPIIRSKYNQIINQQHQHNHQTTIINNISVVINNNVVKVININHQQPPASRPNVPQKPTTPVINNPPPKVVPPPEVKPTSNEKWMRILSEFPIDAFTIKDIQVKLTPIGNQPPQTVTQKHLTFHEDLINYDMKLKEFAADVKEGPFGRVLWAIAISRWYELKQGLKDPITKFTFLDHGNKLTYPLYYVHATGIGYENTRVIDLDTMDEELVADFTLIKGESLKSYGTKLMRVYDTAMKTLRPDPIVRYDSPCKIFKNPETCGTEVWRYIIDNGRYKMDSVSNLIQELYDNRPPSAF